MENKMNQKNSVSSANFFKADLKSAKQQKEFDEVFNSKNGNWVATKSSLAGKEGFTDAIINNLEFTHHLAEWSHNNVDIVTTFQNDKKINSLRDIASTYNKKTFVETITSGLQEGTAEDRQAYALNLHRELFHYEPTVMLVNLAKDPAVPFMNDAVGVNVVSLLEKQPEFNIKTTSVYQLINNAEVMKDIAEDTQPAVKTQLKTLQRIVAISPDLDAVPVLFNAKLHTALQIAEIPRKQFMTMLADKGLDEQTLQQLHSNALQARVRNEQTIMALREVAKGSGVAMIDRAMNMPKTTAATDLGAAATAGSIIEEQSVYMAEALEKRYLSWDLLFGDADYCECGECNSVYSAASYYVELLNYLRNNNLDPDPANPIAIKPDPKNITNTPLEKLFERRPDLACLELTCQNTNTILPYIDLVNEVMENYVAHKRLKAFNVEDETSSELLAAPQHTEYQAYCILKNEVYPLTLPYHQPIDAARIYLDYLDTSRYELIDTFRKNNVDSDLQLTQLKDQALERAADAEYLHITLEEYVILTKECFESKTLIDKLKNKVHTDAEYKTLIGVKPLCNYYGYADNATMLGDDGLTLIKKEFLRRTGIDYFDLVDLLLTQTINPCMPKGKSLAIMESLRFSYRFLQKYAAMHGLDKMAEDLVKGQKLAALLPLLKDGLDLLRGRKELSCPATGKDKIEISDNDLICWVKCQFEKIGKMIVIESGRGCANGKIIGKSAKGVTDANFYVLVKDCKIVIDYRDAEIELGTIDRMTGKVTLNPDVIAENSYELKNLGYLGDKGEKGIFLEIDGDIYLVYLQQKDSCNLDTALLQHLDGSALTLEEYDRIHRFLRLWRKLDWSIDEIDKAIIGLSAGALQKHNASSTSSSICDAGADDCCDTSGDCSDFKYLTYAQDFDINPELIHQLVAVKRLLDATGIELIKLLCFWGEISTAGTKSLYKRLFLTHNILGMDQVFKADNKGHYLTADEKLSDHMPVLMAAFNMSADDIQAVIVATAMDDLLTLKNVSMLYRYRLLAKILGLKVPAFCEILPLLGDVFEHAYESYEFMQRWQKMQQAGFTHQQLNFIINHVDSAKKPFTPTHKQVLQFSKALYDGLNTIDVAHQNLVADPELSDAAQQVINIQEQASSALVRSKAGLLFETAIVEKLLGLLEGSNVYTTNAPKNIEFTLADAKSLKARLQYDATLGTIQIAGVLTATETADYLAIAVDPLWAKALTRIQNQQARLFKELLSGIFEHEATLTLPEKSQLETIINAGDIKIALENIPEGEADTNTAPAKRVAFLKIFLPYLRQQLTHRFIVDSLSNFVVLDSGVTAVLITETLQSGTPAAPIYSIFEKIKDRTKPDGLNWSGYLIPAADAIYTFIVKNSDAAPVITIDGTGLNFTAQEDPTNEWWSASLNLQAGKLYKLATTVLALSNVFWKTPASAITAIPSATLIPDFASEQCKPALIALKKAALLVSGLALSADELRYLTQHAADFSGLDFNAFTLQHWLRLEAYTRLRNALPQTNVNILEFFGWAKNATADAADLSHKIYSLTGWQQQRIEQLIAAEHFNLLAVSDYQNEINLLKLQTALTVVGKIGVDIVKLFDWAVPGSKFRTCRIIADSIRNAIRAKYNQRDWEAVVKPLHDKLRNNQKSALIAYLLQQPELIAWNVTDADGLFEYFLIDVQMQPCMETSRIKQALSSVQLFVQRCFLGLEEEHNGITPSILDRERWDWIQRYRVWEANRKVFLYPENWIESNLRDDKSPFFKELESELLQKDINKQHVIDALKSYLYKVDEVSNMEVIGLFIEGNKSGAIWNANAKLHVFSRTHNAPYMFFHRYLALDEMNWYPWEKMQIDIPVYEVEDSVTLESKGSGCYLAPVVWNGRLLIFFPQIMKKTRPNPASSGGSYSSLGNDANGINNSKPISYLEIKMAWSEYRNRKWTQKQVSNKSVPTFAISSTTDIQYLKFVPILYTDKVKINVDYHLDSDGGYGGAFDFDGTRIDTGSAVSTAGMPIDYFNQSGGQLYSWQLSSTNLMTRNMTVYAYENSLKETLSWSGLGQSEFYHPHTRNMLGRINLGQLDSFFKDNLSMAANDFGPFDHDNNAATPNIYHELKRPYSLYNWEMFLHAPIMLADALSKAQQFEESMKWFHYVFNPIADGDLDNRFWQFQPFKSINSQRVLDSIFNNLSANTSDDAINEWRNKPFMPHVVARSRPVAYMKWVVMKYLDNLIAWGDYLFRQDTIESINQATQIYILAGHILGPKPMTIPKRGNIKPQTYLGLLDKWDAFGNAMVELELAAPFSNQTSLPFGMVNGELAMANIYGIASALYFCIPNNPKLMAYWDTLADRLYKIRHCENIQGVFRKLPLFEPPIDPALLVKAAAHGLSIASVLNDLNTPMPNYRFYYLLQKAIELCAELKSLGNAMLTAIEKQDNEAIALLRAKHDGIMQNLLMEIKLKQLEEAQKNIENLLQNRKAPEARMKYYLKLSGLDEGLLPSNTAEFNGIPNEIVTVTGDSGLKLISFEKEDMDKASDAQDKQLEAALPEKIASIMHIIPNFSGNIQPFGIGMSITFGGSNLGAAAQAWAKFLQLNASELTYASTSAGKKGGFTRALQERIYQANAAGYEIKQIDKQILAQEIRVNIANQEIINQQKAIDNTTEVEEFIKNKYTNEELYNWMRGNLKTLYRQVYNLAYELAKKAEKTYSFERGVSNANFIQAGYFDAGRDGLLAGEQLYVGLKQLESAYQNERGYDFEISKYISLKQLDPLAIIQLRETGRCEFNLPEALFDLDYPGHYKRRIKSVSLSIPCIAGPYTSINASLSLLENKFRNTAIGGKAYEENTEETDDRFSSHIIPINAIAASSAQNDNGMFELNFKDERYLPFEGAGVISRWRLEFPALRQFDYQTIADAVLQLKYTASQGGERLKLAVNKALTSQLDTIAQALNETGLHVMLNMRHDLPNQWHALKQHAAVDLILDKTRLPYMAQLVSNTAIEEVMFIARVENNPVSYAMSIDDEVTDLAKFDALKLNVGRNTDIQLDTTFRLSVATDQLAKLQELMIVIKYTAPKLQ